jgi:hypothetical protein
VLVFSLALALAQNPGAEIDDQIDDLDTRLSSVEDRFGGNAGLYDVAALIPPGGELADGFEVAQQACEARSPWTPCVYLITPGAYTITKRIEFCEEVHVDAYGAEIFANDVGALLFDRNNSGLCNSEGSTWRGGSLKGTIVTSTATRPLPVGIDIRSGVHIRDVAVTLFARGVQAVCNRTSAPQDEIDRGFEIEPTAHCNLVRIDNVTVNSSALDGFYFRGSDANAGVITGASGVHSCMIALQWFPEGPLDESDPAIGDVYQCANFNDASFLGNTWIAPHSAAAYDYRTGPVAVPFFQYYSNAAAGRTVWIGAYAEAEGNGESYMKGYGHLAFGGLNNIKSPRGMTIKDRGTISRATFRAVSAANEELGTTLCLGECDTTGSVLNLESQHGGDVRGLDLRLQAFSDGWLELEASTVTAGRILQIWADDKPGDDFPMGTVRMLKGSLLPQCGDAASPDGPAYFLDEGHTVGTSTASSDGRIMLCTP